MANSLHLDLEKIKQEKASLIAENKSLREQNDFFQKKIKELENLVQVGIKTIQENNVILASYRRNSFSQILRGFWKKILHIWFLWDIVGCKQKPQ